MKPTMEFLRTMYRIDGYSELAYNREYATVDGEMVEQCSVCLTLDNAEMWNMIVKFKRREAGITPTENAQYAHILRLIDHSPTVFEPFVMSRVYDPGTPDHNTTYRTEFTSDLTEALDAECREKFGMTCSELLTEARMFTK